MSDLWLCLIIFLNNKCRVRNKQVLVINHTCSYSQSEITNQSHSTPHFNFLTTGGRQLGTAIQKHRTNWNCWITSAQDIINNAKEKNTITVFCCLSLTFVTIVLCGYQIEKSRNNWIRNNSYKWLSMNVIASKMCNDLKL